MVQNYRKGARGERELIHIFDDSGFNVIRAAGSGVNALSPDILAFRRGKQYALECKAWDSDRVAIEHEKFQALSDWEENTGITTMLAWKMPYEGWFFAYLGELERNERSYSITKRRMQAIGRTLGDLLK